MSNPSEKHYSIRDLSEQTGVNSVTLRAWERRYGLLKPQRSAKGHRYYGPEDVEQVRMILRWLDRGVAISKVKQLINQPDTQIEQTAGDENDHWKEIIRSVMESAADFRCEKLSQQMAELFSNYPLDTLANRFLSPLLEELDRKMTQQFGAGAEKKFIETELSLRLHSQIHHQNANNQGLKLLLVVLGKDERSWQPLLFALACLEAGYRLNLMLDGCDLREIPLIVEKSPVAAVICYSDLRLKEPNLTGELERAAEHSQVPFFVAGQWCAMEPKISRIKGITAVSPSLRDALQAIHEILGEK